MRCLLLSAVAVLSFSSPVLAIGPFSRQVDSYMRASRPDPFAYSRHVQALQGAGGHRYDYAPDAYLSNFGSGPAYGAGGMMTPFGFSPYSYTVTPGFGGATFQGYGAAMGPGFFAPYATGGFVPSYGFGVY